jgi:hypothetical protein
MLVRRLGAGFSRLKVIRTLSVEGGVVAVKGLIDL